MTKSVWGVLLLTALAQAAPATYSSWRHCGSLYVLTTSEGANLPTTASEEGFPLLVRLHKDFFDFRQAKPNGEDIRLSTPAGTSLPYQIDHWDADQGTASIWVRMPVIKGNARQEIKVHWGNSAAACESDGKAVFNESNGYLSVWHMNDPVRDEVGTLESKDTGTTASAGIIAASRRFPGGKGVFCGDKITAFPRGSQPHSSEAWFRAEKPNARILSWGKEYAQGKVQMWYRSPAHIRMDCYFSDADVSSSPSIPTNQWAHVVHTYKKGESRVYVNGVLDGVAKSRAKALAIESPARMWIGGWYNNFDFVGDIDEVRISKVVRSADWVKLQYENQKPLQSLVGLLVQPGNTFSVSPSRLTVPEGKTATVTATVAGAQKLYWILKRDGKETVVAVDRYSCTVDAGRVSGDTSLVLQLKAVYPNGIRTKDVAIQVQEAIPDPVFRLTAPAKWDGRKTIEIVPEIANLDKMRAGGAEELNYSWRISGLAVIKEIAPDKLILHRAQNSGTMAVAATLHSGGQPVSSTVTIVVREPKNDPWLQRTPEKDEKPLDNQFYARDDKNEGTLFCNGTLKQAADAVFLKVYADDKLLTTITQKPRAGRTYAFTAKIKPGLIKYRIELGTRSRTHETILYTAGNIVCGDAFIIDGQSNALATDTHEKSPLERNDWIRSYARPRHYRKDKPQNLWCNPVWKAGREHKAELGWWGMELAKRLLKSQKVPIFIINGAVGGSRIDQHQRSKTDPTDLRTIYGRLLWRVREAKLTHGIRAVLWHQGENDQGAAGPDGDYGWKTYQQYFVDMSAVWKQDFPNVQHYYIFQIWPNSCSMGNGNGDMLREVQRTLPRLYSNMDIMSTLGIKPPGPAHFPLTGWGEFARLIQPLIERDLYGQAPAQSITPPDLTRAYYANDAKDAVVLEFDQPVVWTDSLIDQFYLDGAKGAVASGSASGNVVTLTLKAASAARTITYLKEMSWSQDKLLVGKNSIAAMTFCNVPILPQPSR